MGVRSEDCVRKEGRAMTRRLGGVEGKFIPEEELALENL